MIYAITLWMLTLALFILNLQYGEKFIQWLNKILK